MAVSDKVRSILGFCITELTGGIHRLPTSKQILKLFFHVKFISPVVIAQWGAGFRFQGLEIAGAKMIGITFLKKVKMNPTREMLLDIRLPSIW